MDDLKTKLENLFMLKHELEDREKEFDVANKDLTAEIDRMQAEIKEAVIEKAYTIKTEHISAVYCKGRVTWDSKLLEGIIRVYPDVADARKIGQPTVQFKLIKS